MDWQAQVGTQTVKDFQEYPPRGTEISATNFQQRVTFVGIAWMMLGIALMLDTVLSAWRAWSVLPDASPRSLIFYTPVTAFGLVVLIAGVGCLARKKWARLITIVLSPVLLIYSLGSIVSIIYIYLFLKNLPNVHGVRGVIVTVIFVILVPLSLYTFRLMLSQRGRDAFRKDG